MNPFGHYNFYNILKEFQKNILKLKCLRKVKNI